MRILDNSLDQHRSPRWYLSGCTPWHSHLFLAITLLVCCLTLAYAAKAATDEGSADLELLAQWSLNHGSYLIDVGKYLEALEAFDTSYESSANATTKVRALLHRAMTLATFLDAPEDALKIYRRIEKDFPDHAETGRYRESLLLFDIERYKEAVSTLTAYLRDYPAGRFRFQAEAILEQAQAHIKAGASPIEVPKVPPKKPKPQEPVMVPEKPEPHPDQVKPVARLPVVRVLLYRKTKEVRLEGNGMVLLSGKTKLWKGNQVTLRAQGGKVVVPGQGRVDAEVTLQAQGPVRVAADGGKKTVRGDLFVAASDKRLRVNNHIDIESYLRGVVPSESYPSWPLETLKAQAVAARTYVLYQVRHRTRRAYDVVDNEGDQAYKGVDREHPRTNNAVANTVGEVLIKPEGKQTSKPILAMYSANSGGHTADAKAIFRVDNSILKAQPDPWSLEGKMATWTRRFSHAEVEKRLAKVGVKVNNLQAIEPVTVGPSGRLIRVRLVHDGKPIKVRSRPVLTGALKLPEILVEIRRQDDHFVFNGRGWGHGVGYSQWGGAGMGKKGKTYRDILAYYYSGAELKRLW